MDKKRLTTRPDGMKISFSTHLFFYITLIFGLAFILPPDVLGVATSPLYEFTHAGPWGFWWGVGLIVVFVANTVMLITRSRRLAGIVGVLGFSLWVFAAFAYIFMGFWFGLLVVAIPSLIFWGWYSITVSQFSRSLYDD